MGVDLCAVLLFDKQRRLRLRAIDSRMLDAGEYSETSDQEVLFSSQDVVGRSLNPLSPSVQYWHADPNMDEDDTSPELPPTLLAWLPGCTFVGAVPLVGRHSAFGVVLIGSTEAISPNASSSPINVSPHRLVQFVDSSATAFVERRQRDELAALAEISSMVLELDAHRSSLDEMLTRIAMRLVSTEMPYSGCVVREIASSGELRVAVKLADSLDWTSWVDNPIIEGIDPMRRAFDTGEPFLAPTIAAISELLPNNEWMSRVGVKAYACIPLCSPTESVGTLSVFALHERTFEGHDLDFLQCIASLAATGIISSQRLADIEIGRVQMEKEATHLSGAWATTGASRYKKDLDSLRHRTKNELTNYGLELDDAIQSGTGRLQTLRRLMDSIRARILELTEEIRNAQTESSTSTDLNAIIREVVQLYSPSRRDSGIKTTMQLSHDIPPLDLDSADAKSLVVNLYQNALRAIQHDRSKQGMIEVATWLEYGETDSVVLAIEDTGIGIRNEDREKIFERGMTRYVGGTGQGLFLVQQIVDRYGGTISLETSVGRGSTFTIRLPLAQLALEEM